MGLINYTEISDGTTIDAADVNTPMNTIYDAFNGGIDSNNLADNAVTTAKITDANVTADKIAAGAVTPVKAPDVAKLVNRQDNTTNSVVTNQLVQYGWGFVTGDGVNRAIAEAVTFPVAYDVAPVVMITFIGAKNASDPATVDELVTSSAVIDANCYGTATTGFNANIIRQSQDGADPGALTSGTRYGYSWISIGTKAR